MKTPTIKELRALAKRKGALLYEDDPNLSEAPFTFITESEMTSGDAKEIHAALNALPDKKVAR